MHRSTLLLAAALLSTAVTIPAQSKNELIERRDHKLQKPFIAHAGWITDYDAARAAAKQSDKVIFAYFSRSYAP